MNVASKVLAVPLIVSGLETVALGAGVSTRIGGSASSVSPRAYSRPSSMTRSTVSNCSSVCTT